MEPAPEQGESYLVELRLLLEELCCDLCRSEHVMKEGAAPQSVRIDREFHLGAPGAFADVRIAPALGQPYFVEVKYGYADETLVRHLARKYGPNIPGSGLGAKVVLVIDLQTRPDWPAVQAQVARVLRPGLALEIWDEPRLLAMMRERFQVHFPAITEEKLVDLRQAIDRAKGYHAFGGPSFDEYLHVPLHAELLWRFGFWRLRQLRETGRTRPRDILPPGTYQQVAVVLADLCSFSSYVHDTTDSQIIRECLTAFYSKTRYQIINSGGMLGGFGGDQVIGFFGLPNSEEGYAAAALATAQGLVSIGQSVSCHWQRRIDRLQIAGGLRVGVALGDLEIVSLRPFSRAHFTAIGDCFNMAARLMNVAGPNELVVSNSFHQKLSEAAQAEFRELEPVEARNVGRIQAWKATANPFSGMSG